jgi:hypothetical protein
MTMSEHTIKAFDADLQDLTRVVVEMGAWRNGRSSMRSRRWRSTTPGSRSA